MRNIIILVLIAMSFSACEKAFFEEVPSTDPKSIFEQTWQFTNAEYSFFEFKNIDWDSIYTVYEPKISNDMSEEALFETLGNMLYVLKDGHVNLMSNFNRSRNWTWYLEAPDNYDEYLLERSYFKEKQQYVGPFTIYDFGDIGYIYYGSFSNSFTSNDLDYIFEKFKNHKGVIFDIRNNFGGSLSNVYSLGARFIDQTTEVAKTRTKNGPGRNDFTDLNTLSFMYNENDMHFTKPVVLLTNRKSYSAANYFPTCMSALKNVTIMGDATGGGGGAPAFTELSNGWVLRVSSNQLYTLDGINTENGLQPDIKIDIKKEDLDAGIDTILEEALKLLRN